MHPPMKNVLAGQFSLLDQKHVEEIGVPTNLYECCCFTFLEHSLDGATGFIHL